MTVCGAAFQSFWYVGDAHAQASETEAEESVV